MLKWAVGKDERLGSTPTESSSSKSVRKRRKVSHGLNSPRINNNDSSKKNLNTGLDSGRNENVESVEMMSSGYNEAGEKFIQKSTSRSSALKIKGKLSLSSLKGRMTRNKNPLMTSSRRTSPNLGSSGSECGNHSPNNSSAESKSLLYMSLDHLPLAIVRQYERMLQDDDEDYDKEQNKKQFITPIFRPPTKRIFSPSPPHLPPERNKKPSVQIKTKPTLLNPPTVRKSCNGPTSGGDSNVIRVARNRSLRVSRTGGGSSSVSPTTTGPPVAPPPSILKNKRKSFSTGEQLSPKANGRREVENRNRDGDQAVKILQVHNGNKSERFCQAELRKYDINKEEPEGRTRRAATATSPKAVHHRESSNRSREFNSGNGSYLMGVGDFESPVGRRPFKNLHNLRTQAIVGVGKSSPMSKVIIPSSSDPHDTTDPQFLENSVIGEITIPALTITRCAKKLTLKRSELRKLEKIRHQTERLNRFLKKYYHDCLPNLPEEEEEECSPEEKPLPHSRQSDERNRCHHTRPFTFDPSSTDTSSSSSSSSGEHPFPLRNSSRWRGNIFHKGLYLSPTDPLQSYLPIIAEDSETTTSESDGAFRGLEPQGEVEPVDTFIHTRTQGGGKAHSHSKRDICDLGEARGSSPVEHEDESLVREGFVTEEEISGLEKLKGLDEIDEPFEEPPPFESGHNKGSSYPSLTPSPHPSGSSSSTASSFISSDLSSSYSKNEAGEPSTTSKTTGRDEEGKVVVSEESGNETWNSHQEYQPPSSRDSLALSDINTPEGNSPINSGTNSPMRNSPIRDSPIRNSPMRNSPIRKSSPNRASPIRSISMSSPMTHEDESCDEDEGGKDEGTRYPLRGRNLPLTTPTRLTCRKRSGTPRSAKKFTPRKVVKKPPVKSVFSGKGDVLIRTYRNGDYVTLHVVQAKNLQPCYRSSWKFAIKISLIPEAETTFTRSDSITVERNRSSVRIDEKFSFEIPANASSTTSRLADKKIFFTFWKRIEKKTAFLGWTTLDLSTLNKYATQSWLKLRKRKMNGGTTTSAQTFTGPCVPPRRKKSLPLEIETVEEVTRDDGILEPPELDDYPEEEIKTTLATSSTMDSGVEDCCEPPPFNPPLDLDDRCGRRIVIRMAKTENCGYGFTVVWVTPPRIERLEKDKMADHAGLRIGDLIIGVNGEDVTTLPNTTIYHKMKTTGNELELELWRRNGQLHGHHQVAQLPTTMPSSQTSTLSNRTSSSSGNSSTNNNSRSPKEQSSSERELTQPGGPLLPLHLSSEEIRTFGTPPPPPSLTNIGPPPVPPSLSHTPSPPAITPPLNNNNNHLVNVSVEKKVVMPPPRSSTLSSSSAPSVIAPPVLTRPPPVSILKPAPPPVPLPAKPSLPTAPQSTSASSSWKIRFNVELLDNEDDFLRQFFVCELKFFRKVVAALDRYLIPAQTNRLLTPQEIHLIFAQIITIITTTKRILQCVANGASKSGWRLSDSLRSTHSDHLSEMIAAYRAYGKNLGNCAQLLSEKMSIQQFACFVLETPVPKGHLDLTSLLFVPLEHLRNLCEICEEISHNFEDWADIGTQLKECYADIVCETDYMEPISHINMKKNPLLSVRDLEKRLVSTKFEALKVSEKGRKWLFGSRLFRRESDGSWAPVWAFLFTDIVVLTSHTTRDRVFFVKEPPIRLEDVVTLHFNLPKKHENEFRLLFGPEHPQTHHRFDKLLPIYRKQKSNQIVLRTSNPQLKSVWKLLLQRQIITLNTRLSKSSSSNFSISEFCEKFPTSPEGPDEFEPPESTPSSKDSKEPLKEISKVLLKLQEKKRENISGSTVGKGGVENDTPPKHLEVKLSSGPRPSPLLTDSKSNVNENNSTKSSSININSIKATTNGKNDSPPSNNNSLTNVKNSLSPEKSVTLVEGPNVGKSGPGGIEAKSNLNATRVIHVPDPKQLDPCEVKVEGNLNKILPLGKSPSLPPQTPPASGATSTGLNNSPSLETAPMGNHNSQKQSSEEKILPNSMSKSHGGHQLHSHSSKPSPMSSLGNPGKLSDLVSALSKGTSPQAALKTTHVTGPADSPIKKNRKEIDPPIEIDSGHSKCKGRNSGTQPSTPAKSNSKENRRNSPPDLSLKNVNDDQKGETKGSNDKREVSSAGPQKREIKNVKTFCSQTETEVKRVSGHHLKINEPGLKETPQCFSQPKEKVSPHLGSTATLPHCDERRGSKDAGSRTASLSSPEISEQPKCIFTKEKPGTKIVTNSYLKSHQEVLSSAPSSMPLFKEKSSLNGSGTEIMKLMNYQNSPYPVKRFMGHNDHDAMLIENMRTSPNNNNNSFRSLLDNQKYPERSHSSLMEEIPNPLVGPNTQRILETSSEKSRRRILFDQKVRKDYPELFGITPRDRRSFIKNLGNETGDVNSLVTPYYYTTSPLPAHRTFINSQPKTNDYVIPYKENNSTILLEQNNNKKNINVQIEDEKDSENWEVPPRVSQFRIKENKEDQLEDLEDDSSIRCLELHQCVVHLHRSPEDSSNDSGISDENTDQNRTLSNLEDTTMSCSIPSNSSNCSDNDHTNLPISRNLTPADGNELGPLQPPVIEEEEIKINYTKQEVPPNPVVNEKENSKALVTVSTSMTNINMSNGSKVDVGIGTEDDEELSFLWASRLPEKSFRTLMAERREAFFHNNQMREHNKHLNKNESNLATLSEGRTQRSFNSNEPLLVRIVEGIGTIHSTIPDPPEPIKPCERVLYTRLEKEKTARVERVESSDDSTSSDAASASPAAENGTTDPSWSSSSSSDLAGYSSSREELPMASTSTSTYPIINSSLSNSAKVAMFSGFPHGPSKLPSVSHASTSTGFVRRPEIVVTKESPIKNESDEDEESVILCNGNRTLMNGMKKDESFDAIDDDVEEDSLEVIAEKSKEFSRVESNDSTAENYGDDEDYNFDEDEEELSHCSVATMNRYGTYESLEKIETEESIGVQPDFSRALPRSKARFTFDDDDDDEEDLFEEDFETDFNFRFPSQIQDNTYSVSRLGPLPPLLEEDYEDEMYDEARTDVENGDGQGSSDGGNYRAGFHQTGLRRGENSFLLARLATIYARSSISPLKILRDLWLKKRYRQWNYKDE